MLWKMNCEGEVSEIHSIINPVCSCIQFPAGAKLGEICNSLAIPDSNFMTAGCDDSDICNEHAT